MVVVHLSSLVLYLVAPLLIHLPNIFFNNYPHVFEESRECCDYVRPYGQPYVSDRVLTPTLFEIQI